MRLPRHLLLLPLLLLAAGCGPPFGLPPSVPPLYTHHLDVPLKNGAPQRLRVGYVSPWAGVITVDEGGGLSAVWSQGRGQLSAAATLETGLTSPVVDARLAQLTRRQMPALVALLPRSVVLLDYGGERTLTVRAPGGHLAPGHGYRDLLVGDFNADGNLGLFIVGDTGCDLWRAPDFKAAQDPRPPALLPDPEPVVAYLDGSHRADVVGMRQGPDGPELVALMNQASGRFTVQVAPPLPSGYAITAISARPASRILVGGKGFLASYPVSRDGVIGRPRVATFDGLDPLAVGTAPLGYEQQPDILVTNRDGKLLTFVSRGADSTEYLEAPPQSVGPSPTGLASVPIFGTVRGEAMVEQDIVVSNEGAGSPPEGAGVHAFSGGPFTGGGRPALNFNWTP